jgi:hypothetical protein
MNPPNKKRRIEITKLEIANDVWSIISEYLDTRTFIRLIQTCKTMNELKTISKIMSKKPMTLRKSISLEQNAQIVPSYCANLIIHSRQSLPDTIFQCLDHVTHLTLHVYYPYSIPQECINYLYQLESLIIPKTVDLLCDFSQFVNLKFLDISESEATDSIVNTLAPLKKLTHLYARSCFVETAEMSQSSLLSFIGELPNLRVLDVSDNGWLVACSEFQYFTNLTELNISYTTTSLTYHLFQYLKKLKVLSMSSVKSMDINDVAFGYLTELEYLDISQSKLNITDHAFSYTPNLKTLIMAFYENQYGSLSDKLFSHLSNLRNLSIAHCPYMIPSDESFYYLRNLHVLLMSHTSETNVTDNAFSYISNVYILEMNGCDKFSDAAFLHLKNLGRLEMVECGQASVTDVTFKHLENTLYSLTIDPQRYWQLSSKALTLLIPFPLLGESIHSLITHKSFENVV